MLTYSILSQLLLILLILQYWLFLEPKEKQNNMLSFFVLYIYIYIFRFISPITGLLWRLYFEYILQWFSSPQGKWRRHKRTWVIWHPTYNTCTTDPGATAAALCILSKLYKEDYHVQSNMQKLHYFFFLHYSAVSDSLEQTTIQQGQTWLRSYKTDFFPSLLQVILFFSFFLSCL